MKISGCFLVPFIVLSTRSEPDRSREERDCNIWRNDYQRFNSQYHPVCTECTLSLYGIMFSCEDQCDRCNGNLCARYSFTEEFVYGISGPVRREDCFTITDQGSPYIGNQLCVRDGIDYSECEATINGASCMYCLESTSTFCLYEPKSSMGRIMDCSNIVAGSYFDGCGAESTGIFEQLGLGDNQESVQCGPSSLAFNAQSTYSTLALILASYILSCQS